MHAFSFLVVAATLVFGASATPTEKRQEAARFGLVTVSPSTVSTGDSFTITFNNTRGRFDPDFVDFYIQGTRANNNPTPYVALSRHDYSAGQLTLTSTETTPDLSILGDDVSSWLVWAFLTYPSDGLEQIGGTSAVLDYE